MEAFLNKAELYTSPTFMSIIFYLFLIWLSIIFILAVTLVAYSEFNYIYWNTVKKIWFIRFSTEKELEHNKKIVKNKKSTKRKIKANFPQTHIFYPSNSSATIHFPPFLNAGIVCLLALFR